MNKSNHRSPFAIVGRLIVLVKPMLPVMLAAIVMGVAGHFCATFITIFGGFGILRALGLASPVRTVGTAFACILVFALLRGVLRYAEQASNHYIAFKLLALIRDKVFGALRRLTPAKLEGRDRGDLISLITADIEALEVFYAHTISPICIACICVIGMTGFVGSWHILPALVLLAGYLLVGVALPVWSAKRGDRAAREYRQALADTNSYVLESLRGLKDTLQYQDTAARAEGITAHSEMLGEKQKAMKYREGLTVAITNTLILLTVLAVLGVSLNLYQNGKMGVEGVLVCTLSALSSFGPVVALANLGASLTQVFASADRVLDLLDEQPVTADVTDGTDTAFVGAAAEHVNFAYADEEVLHDLSLTIPEKKIVGITGRSGSGKSTFLRLLMRFWDVSSGSIRFGAEDIRRVNTAALREQESLVTQETELFDDTIENNIRKKVVERMVINPAYYAKMSEILEQLILDRRRGVIAYGQLLDTYMELAKNVAKPEENTKYPESIRSNGALRALYDNCGEDEATALKLHKAIVKARLDGFRNNPVKANKIKRALYQLLNDDSEVERIYQIVVEQEEY